MRLYVANSTGETLPLHRRWLVGGLACALILGHAFDVFTKGEHWPVSSYPMYAELMTERSFRLIRLVGVTDNQPPREVPFDSAWLRKSLSQIVRRPDARKRLRRAVIDYAAAAGWERRREGGPFVAYRVYDQTWDLRPERDPDRPPDRNSLLFELRREAEGQGGGATP
jgi:hypothetical protein